MSRRANVINTILTMAITFATLFLVVFMCDKRYDTTKFMYFVLWILIGALVAGLVNAFTHELGHLISGKRNGFKLSCLCVWFFKWTKIGKKFDFSFTFPWNEAGYTEMVPTKEDNMEKR